MIRRNILPQKVEGSKESLHKQPRNYFKTQARLVGKATDEITLFSQPEIGADGNIIGEIRKVISRNTAILGHYLLQLWQENGQEELVLNNLSHIAEIMNNSNHEVKIYLLYLGGYVYPIEEIDEQTGELSITIEQLFKIRFKYSKEVSEKQFEKIGTNLVSFIKDESAERIVITPSPLFVKALKGKGLGNVLVANDKFIKLALSLSDIAFKILSYSASNHPNQRIGGDKLIKQLGLEKQVKTQSRSRVRDTILKGLQELKEKEHIKEYSYDETTNIYDFTYSDVFIKHNDFSKKKKT